MGEIIFWQGVTLLQGNHPQTGQSQTIGQQAARRAGSHYTYLKRRLFCHQIIPGLRHR